MASSADNTCCVCEEAYNLEERKPLLLPCSHTFCRSCLNKLKSTNNCLCPVCRKSWRDRSIARLPLVRQLADASDQLNIKTKLGSGNQNICVKHNSDLIAWCKICKVSICITCLQTDQKSCEWITTEEKTTELIGKLLESVTSTRTELIENFTIITIENMSLLTDIRKSIEKLQYYEKIVQSFHKRLSTKQENAMNKLEKYENTSTDSGVAGLEKTISKTLSLLDPLAAPKIPTFVVPDCEEVADYPDLESELNGGTVGTYLHWCNGGTVSTYLHWCNGGTVSTYLYWCDGGTVSTYLYWCNGGMLSTYLHWCNGGTVSTYLHWCNGGTVSTYLHPLVYQSHGINGKYLYLHWCFTILWQGIAWIIVIRF